MKVFLEEMGRLKCKLVFSLPQDIFMFILEANTFQRYERNARAPDRLNGWGVQKTKQ